MKLPRLPETDLANCAALPRDAKVAALKRFKAGGGFWSYDPVRRSTTAIFHVTGALGLVGPRLSADQIRSQVRRACKNSDDQRKSNLGIVDLLHPWAVQHVTAAGAADIAAMSLGSMGPARYCENFVAQGEAGLFIPFFDFRRNNGLTELGRRVGFSMMREQSIMTDPELASCRLLILRFPQQLLSGTRVVKSYWSDGVELFDSDTLGDLIRETYELWAEVWFEREEAARRAGGGAGPLFER